MNPTTYAAEVDRTRRRVDVELPQETYLIGHSLGLVGEAGEVADLVKKWVLHGHELDKPKLIKELGDVLWYNVALRLDTGAALPTDWLAIEAALPELTPQEVSALAIQCARTSARYAGGEGGVWLLNDQLLELAALGFACGVSLAEIAATNIAKLRARFPAGFTAAASQARADVAGT